MPKQTSLNILEITLRAKALYLSTLPIIDKSLARDYMGEIYPNEKVTREMVTPVANLVLIKFIWYYLKLFKIKITDNKNNFNLFKYSLFSLFENNFNSDPEILIDKVNRDIPEDVFVTNWFERELVNQLSKTDLLENLSALTLKKHFDLAKKIWHGVWKLKNDNLTQYTNNLTKMAVFDYLEKLIHEN